VLELDPLQIEAARVALQWSKLHCRELPGVKADCGWYHGFWQIVRVLGVGRVTGGHADFLFDVLREHARDPLFRRVLVSGTADHAMPALVYRAYEAAGTDVDLTVLDWCGTPLALCHWYAERSGRRVRTVRADILDPGLTESFDVVLANSFLGYFQPDQRPELFRRWAELLRPGGKAVLTNRVRATGGEGLIGFGNDAARRFRAEIDARMQGQAEALGMDADVIADAAREYVRRFAVYPVSSHAELHRQLGFAGFGDLQSDLAQSHPDADAIAGPSTNEQGTYARIVATRS